MDNKIQSLKVYITELSANKSFIHHKWFVKWHLELVEKISLELCDLYPDADRDLVQGLVWMHDYAKIIDFDNEHDLEIFAKGISVLKDLGFEDNFITKLMEYIEIFESKLTLDLRKAPIEIKIVSSADAASHMIGPFMAIHWYENPDKSVEQLIEANERKLDKDWNRKIVLPEVKEAFQKQYESLRLLTGIFPEKFIK